MSDQKTNPYCMGDWVNLSPNGNSEHRRSMVKRSAISIVMRLFPEKDVRGDGSHLHGVVIRADGAEQVLRFGGEGAAEHADLLAEACMRRCSPPPETYRIDRETFVKVAKLLISPHAVGDQVSLGRARQVADRLRDADVVAVIINPDHRRLSDVELGVLAPS